MRLLAGPHVNRTHAPGARPGLAAHVEAAVAEAAAGGFAVGAVAFFVASPRARALTLRPSERPELAAYLARSGIAAYAHNSYTADPWGAARAGAAAFIREQADAPPPPAHQEDSGPALMRPPRHTINMPTCSHTHSITIPPCPPCYHLAPTC